MISLEKICIALECPNRNHCGIYGRAPEYTRQTFIHPEVVGDGCHYYKQKPIKTILEKKSNE